MDFKSLDGTLFVSRVSFPPRAKATGFPSSREVFMIQVAIAFLAIAFFM